MSVDLLPQPVQRRLGELIRDGYLKVINGHPILTEKGWCMVFASAEPVIQKSQLKAEPKPIS
jgi:hypothetical protein